MIDKRVIGMILCMLMITTVVSVQISAVTVKRLYIDEVVGDFRGEILFIFRNVGNETLNENIEYTVSIEGGKFGKINHHYTGQWDYPLVPDDYGLGSSGRWRIFGLGKVNITIEVPYANPWKGTCYVFGPITYRVWKDH